MDLQDKIITCIDCQEEFLFSAGEQAYFLSKELSEPKRCPACRKARRESIVKATKEGDR